MLGGSSSTNNWLLLNACLGRLLVFSDVDESNTQLRITAAFKVRHHLV